ncbi:MAG TPA: transposase [Acetobacteraceae bacterium]|nr:transposase [Acetobacteraceae bacterium]
MGRETVSSFLEAAGTKVDTTGGKRSRRSWSDEDKRRIVEEAIAPGASVANIARRYGVNANLLFNWRKAARASFSAATAAVSASAPTPAEAQISATQACAFIPIGVLGSAEDGASALAVGSSPAVAGGASSRCAPLPRLGLEERPGVIEIDLADGVRLRVDAFVNERALRRVLTVLKVAS